MTDPDDDFAPPPPRSRFRWMRKVAFWGLGLFAAIAFVLFLGRWQTGRLGQRQLTVTTNRLDADDPGWRLDDIMAARQKAAPADNENAAPTILKLADNVPDEWKKWRGSAAAAPWDRTVDNRLPPQDAITGARDHAPATAVVRTEALRLRDTRSGQFAFTLTPDPYTIILAHLDKCRTVVSLLQYDGHLSVLEKNPNRGVSAARAALAATRAIKDEPFLISQLVRIACATVAAQTAVQVLAWGEPTEGLAELQAELIAEAEFAHLQSGLRGERGAIDMLFRGLQDGTIPAESWFSYLDIRPGPEHYAAFRAYKALIPGDHAKALEILTAYIEAAKRPPHEQLAALKVIPIPPGPPDEFRYILARHIVPACSKIAEADLRCRANLLCAATGVACERYRLKNGRWPGALADLVPAFLPAIPQSPFDGKPLSYRVFPDRIAVYCFWANASLDRQDYPDEFRGDVPGIGYGCRLWNPDRRGRPAEEKKDP
ncbi:hypothetical protein [Frigoriglobus tundricola]|uniref:Long-chain-fatty-acid--CoA ligase n=1 Tax=Frigoriglobus tundricola TaxID=2774151 RepID=A0A6M5YHK0_9BACT|nr:hypothetical protein [Frigoriglobus tundricola]QJW93517.1 Long-chain-fatty-acid--CoA ligase [Frigoriglobus tundricola]